MSMIKDILNQGRARGVFEVSDLNAYSKAIYFALKGLEYPWMTDLSNNELRSYVNLLVEILLKGISK